MPVKPAPLLHPSSLTLTASERLDIRAASAGPAAREAMLARSGARRTPTGWPRVDSRYKLSKRRIWMAHSRPGSVVHNRGIPSLPPWRASAVCSGHVVQSCRLVLDSRRRWSVGRLQGACVVCPRCLAGVAYRGCCRLRVAQRRGTQERRHVRRSLHLHPCISARVEVRTIGPAAPLSREFCAELQSFRTEGISDGMANSGRGKAQCHAGSAPELTIEWEQASAVHNPRHVPAAALPLG